MNHAAVRWHLQHNHYPPIHLDWLPAIEQAEQAIIEGEMSRDIACPNDPIAPTGTTTTNAWRIIESFGLDHSLSDEAYDAWHDTLEGWRG